MDRNSFLRVLKGAPLSVLIGLWVYGHMGRREIAMRTGWKEKTVDDALLVLEVEGLVCRVHYRQWALSTTFFQLPFPFGGLLAESAESVNFTSSATAATAAAANSSRELAAVAVGSAESVNFTSSATTAAANSSRDMATVAMRTAEDRDYRLSAKLLVEAGIGAGSVKLREILERGLSYDYVHAHVAKWRGERGMGVGLLIRRLLDGDPLPANKTNNGYGYEMICRVCSVSPCQCDD